MTTTLRAKVQRSRIGGAWLATAYIGGIPQDSNICYSWAEAMQQAQAMLVSLDATLMDEVHASRAARRGGCPSCEHGAAALGHNEASMRCKYHRTAETPQEAPC